MYIESPFFFGFGFRVVFGGEADLIIDQRGNILQKFFGVRLLLIVIVYR